MSAVRAAGPIRRHYWRMLLAGLDPAAAGNLTAQALGLRPAAGGWTPGELETLLFLRWCYRHRDRLQ